MTTGRKVELLYGRKKVVMKRMVLIAAIAFSVASCAQHDTNTPDTSGNDPQSPNATRPASDSALPGANGSNMNSGGTNQSTGTADSTMNRNQQTP